MLIRTYRRIPAREGLDAELAALRVLESDPNTGETLLLWEANDPCVVLPRSGSLEKDLLASARSELPVLRRESGGGAVLLGPGCLNYALVLSLDRRPELVDVERSYAQILGALASALPLSGAYAVGSDLVCRDRKFGGHAQRRTRGVLLHHGTLLYDSDLQRISGVLREPVRQPPYRRGRTHDRFLMNAPISLDLLLPAFESVAAALEPRVVAASSLHSTYCSTRGRESRQSGRD